MSNSVGVIDSGYRGEIMVTFNISNPSKTGQIYQIGDRIAQLVIVPVPLITYAETQELSETNRGTGGHGSTGV
jgi:dUTP pyrophosphatase